MTFSAKSKPSGAGAIHPIHFAAISERKMLRLRLMAATCKLLCRTSRWNERQVRAVLGFVPDRMVALEVLMGDVA